MREGEGEREGEGGMDDLMRMMTVAVVISSLIVAVKMIVSPGKRSAATKEVLALVLMMVLPLKARVVPLAKMRLDLLTLMITDNPEVLLVEVSGVVLRIKRIPASSSLPIVVPIAIT